MKSLSIIVKNFRNSPLRIIGRNFNPSIAFSSAADSKMESAERAKKAAAYRAIDDHIKGDCTVGIGSGSTIIYAVERLSQVVKESRLKVSCVPTSMQAKQLIRKHKLYLSDLDEFPQLDYVFDGADEVDSDLNLIKGGGGCLTQEKIVASCTSNLIILADSSKDSLFLCEKWHKGIPIEVIPMAYVPVKNQIEAIGGVAVLRMAKAKAGPVITDNGNFILDWKYNVKQADWKSVNEKLISIPGVLDTGLFIDMASKVYFGYPDGSVCIKDRKS